MTLIVRSLGITTRIHINKLGRIFFYCFSTCSWGYMPSHCSSYVLLPPNILDVFGYVELGFNFGFIKRSAPLSGLLLQHFSPFFIQRKSHCLILKACLSVCESVHGVHVSSRDPLVQCERNVWTPSSQLIQNAWPEPTEYPPPSLSSFFITKLPETLLTSEISNLPLH